MAIAREGTGKGRREYKGDSPKANRTEGRKEEMEEKCGCLAGRPAGHSYLPLNRGYK